MSKLPDALKCYSDQESINKRLTTVENKITELQLAENSLSITTKNVESQLKLYHKTVTDMISEQPMSTRDHTSATSSISTESVQHIASSLVAEQREKERRQLNIIVHNLKESASTDGAARKQDDINECVALLERYLGISVSISKAFRLGKKSDKPRLLKVSLSTTQEKALVLKNKAKLRSKDHPEHVRRLFITPDLTPFEQKQSKALRQQLVDMNKVQNVYMIKNGSIVRRT